MTRDELRRIEYCVQNDAEDELNDTLRQHHPALFKAKRALVAKASDRLCQTQALILRETAPEINALIVTALRQSASPQPQGWQPTAEVCVCAAVKLDDGRIFRGHRHHNAMAAAGEGGFRDRVTQAMQGFMTTGNRFVDRKEGMRLQKAAGIESADRPGRYRKSEDLYSEDLY